MFSTVAVKVSFPLMLPILMEHSGGEKNAIAELRKRIVVRAIAFELEAVSAMKEHPLYERPEVKETWNAVAKQRHNVLKHAAQTFSVRLLPNSVFLVGFEVPTYGADISGRDEAGMPNSVANVLTKAFLSPAKEPTGEYESNYSDEVTKVLDEEFKAALDMIVGRPVEDQDWPVCSTPLWTAHIIGDEEQEATLAARNSLGAMSNAALSELLHLVVSSSRSVPTRTYADMEVLARFFSGGERPQDYRFFEEDAVRNVHKTVPFLADLHAEALFRYRNENI